MKKFGLLMETESIQLELRCAIKALRLVGDALEREVAAIKREDGFVSADYLQDLSDALYSVFGTLDGLNLRLETEIDEEYRKKENSRD